MITMTEERAPGAQEERQPARVIIRRPASGIGIDPKRLIAWRSRRALSRAELAARIAALGWTDEAGHPVRYTRDAIAKAENGYRQPKPRTVRALCAALSTEEDPCQPLDLQPDGPDVELPPDVRRRLARLDYNAAMREFAVRHGFRYKDAGSGRVYYPRRLREAYAQHVLDLAVQDAGSTDAPDGETLDLARQDLRQPGPEPAVPEPPRLDQDALEPLARPQDLPRPELPVPDLGLSARVRNSLLREGIATAGQLAACSRADLADIRDLGPRGRDEIIAKIAELAAAGAGPGEQLAS